jgi:hypothetical protein
MEKPFCKGHDSIDLSRLEFSLMAFARVRRLYLLCLKIVSQSLESAAVSPAE